MQSNIGMRQPGVILRSLKYLMSSCKKIPFVLSRGIRSNQADIRTGRYTMLLEQIQCTYIHEQLRMIALRDEERRLTHIN